MLKRRVSLDFTRSNLLLGPRRVGKSTLIRHLEQPFQLIDLLKTDVFFEYRSRPALLREQFAKTAELIVIDEVQKIPELLSEVHWLIENSGNRFLLTGSSARKLRRSGGTNLAGRLKTVHLHPLTYAEIPGFDLLDRLQYGSLPPIVLGNDPWGDLKDYCGEYLKEEILAEGLVRNIPAFSRFLELSALSNSEQLSYAAIARDSGVSAKTVAEYFQILVDTLLGHFLEPYTRTVKRRSVMTAKFYYFDTGVPNILLRRRLSEKTGEFGKAFEHFLVLETIAAQSYGKALERLNYWRSSNGYEVDLLLNEEIAVEFKSGPIHLSHTKGIMALAEELPLKGRWIVGREARPRTLANGVEVLPWQEYLRRLGAGELG